MSPQIILPLDIPDVEVIKTETTGTGAYVIVVSSKVNGTICRQCGCSIEKFHGHDRWIHPRHRFLR